MKRFILLFVFIFLAFGCASQLIYSKEGIEENKTKNSLDYIRSGEYAFYLDKRFKDTYYRGYMRFSTDDGKNLIFARNMNLNSGKEESFMFIVTDDENGYPLNIEDIRGEFSKEETRQAIPDFFNFTTLFLNTRNSYNVQSEVDDKWDDYTLVFNFNKILPFFNFYDIKLKGENKSNYILEYGGVLNYDKAQDFFKMKPINRKNKKTKQAPNIPKKNTKKVEMNGVSINLDENWVYQSNEELSGYWLSLKTKRDSQIAIEKADLNDFNFTEENYYLFYKFIIFQAGDAIEMDSLKVQKTKNGYVLECYLWQNGERNYQMLELILNKKEIIIVNFSSFSEIFDKNKDYYKKIFDSILIN